MSLLDSHLREGRKWARLGDFFEITRKPRGLSLRDYSTVPFITMEAIPQGIGITPRYETKPVDALSSGTYFERGDLLIAKITPSFENGKQAITDGLDAVFGFASTELIPLRPRVSGHDKRLIFFYLLHPDIRAYVASRMEGSTGRQRVPEQVLLDLPFPELPLEEQRAIADTLEWLSAAIRLESRGELKTRELKRAAMRELFTRGLRGGPLKASEIGLVPENWNVTTFAAVRQWLQYGTSTRCSAEAGIHPVLRIPNIEPGRVNTTNLKYCDLSESEAKKYRLVDGDLLFIRTNGVLDRLGSCAVYAGQPEQALFASYLIRARLKPHVDPRFVAFFFGSDQGTELVAGRATPAADGKYNLNTGTIDSLPLPLPTSLDEQREIVAILEALDRKIELHRRKRRVLEELFKSLLDKLITGEIRVSDLDLSVFDGTPRT